MKHNPEKSYSHKYWLTQKNTIMKKPAKMFSTNHSEKKPRMAKV